MELLVLQNHIPHYRLSTFDHLGALEDTELTILHSGTPTFPVENSFSYNEIITQAQNVGSLVYQQGVMGAALKADVIIAMFDMHWVNNALLGLLPESSRKRLIYWGHGYGRTKLTMPVQSFFARQAGALLLYSERDIEAFVRAGVRREKIFIAPNTQYVPSRPVLNSDSRNRFVFVGRLRPAKKVEELLLAFHQAMPRMPQDIALDIVGDGPSKSQLYDLANRLGILSRVTFHGSITEHSALQNIYAQSIAYISPGPVGLGVLHSFAHGVPVVTTGGIEHGPEIENLVEDENGLLYDGAIQSLAGSLIRLSMDADLHRYLGRNALNHYWSSRTVPQMVDGFQKAIDYVRDRRRYA